LLEAVQDEQQRALREVVPQTFEVGRAGRREWTKRLRDRRRDELGIGDRPQRDERAAVFELVGQSARELERKPRLADSAGAGDREQANVGSSYERRCPR
jgi:hypothetical protein